jgi:hypothetical protein
MSALLQRCRLEGHYSRTVERAMMQTEVFVYCLPLCLHFLWHWHVTLYSSHEIHSSRFGLYSSEVSPNSLS